MDTDQTLAVDWQRAGGHAMCREGETAKIGLYATTKCKRTNGIKFTGHMIKGN